MQPSPMARTATSARKRSEPGVERRLILAFRELSAGGEDPAGWIQRPRGADLWIDGRIALRAASHGDLFLRAVRAFLDYCGRAGAPVHALEEEGLASLLGRLDPFLEACASHGQGSFWPGLALGLALIESRGGPPRIEMSDAATMNDSLALVLSPSYRALRFAGYNTGIRVRCTTGRSLPPFRPELGCFLIGPPPLILEELPRVQFFNVCHDLVHIVLFGDAYMRTVGTLETTAALLLNAEETACTLDLVLARDLARFGVELRALTELVQIESGRRVGQPSVTLRVSLEGEGFTAYQAALKAASQRHLSAWTPVSRRIGEGVSIPPDLGDWFDPRAQQTHAAWHEDMAERVWNPVFQRFVSLLPPIETHLENLLRFTRETWEPDQPVLDEIPEPCQVARAQGILLYRLRSLVIRAADVAAELAAAGSFSTALADDLTEWALAVVEELIRVRRSGASPATQERCELLAQAVCSLLERHGAQAGLAARFEDPMTVPSRAAA